MCLLCGCFCSSCRTRHVPTCRTPPGEGGGSKRKERGISHPKRSGKGGAQRRSAQAKRGRLRETPCAARGAAPLARLVFLICARQRTVFSGSRCGRNRPQRWERRTPCVRSAGGGLLPENAEGAAWVFQFDWELFSALFTGLSRTFHRPKLSFHGRSELEFTAGGGCSAPFGGVEWILICPHQWPSVRTGRFDVEVSFDWQAKVCRLCAASVK